MESFIMLKLVEFKRLIAAQNYFELVIHYILNLRIINTEIHTGRAGAIQNATPGDEKYQGQSQSYFTTGGLPPVSSS
jgi:hypothetical protein